MIERENNFRNNLSDSYLKSLKCSSSISLTLLNDLITEFGPLRIISDNVNIKYFKKNSKIYSILGNLIKEIDEFDSKSNLELLYQMKEGVLIDYNLSINSFANLNGNLPENGLIFSNDSEYILIGGNFSPKNLTDEEGLTWFKYKFIPWINTYKGNVIFIAGENEKYLAGLYNSDVTKQLPENGYYLENSYYVDSDVEIYGACLLPKFKLNNYDDIVFTDLNKKFKIILSETPIETKVKVDYNCSSLTEIPEIKII